MSVKHYSDNPTNFTEHTLDGNQVTVDSWANLSPLGYLAEQVSITGYESNAQLDDMTSNNFASVQGAR